MSTHRYSIWASHQPTRFIKPAPRTKIRQKFNKLLIGFCIFVIGSASALAQERHEAETYPNRPIRFIVPFAPGGGNDMLARTVGQELTEAWAQRVVVDNRAGAGGNIAAEISAPATPDGYTLFLLNSANLIAPSLYRRIAYDPIKDFAPITLMVSSPFLIVVHPEMPVRSVGDLIALGRKGEAEKGTHTFSNQSLPLPPGLVRDLPDRREQVLEHRARAEVDLGRDLHAGNEPQACTAKRQLQPYFSTLNLEINTLRWSDPVQQGSSRPCLTRRVG